MLREPGRTSLLSLFCLILLLLAPLYALATPRYTVTVLAGAGSQAYDLNIHGEVAGGSGGNAWIYRGGVANVIGSGVAYSINDSGQAAGSYPGSGFFYDGALIHAIPGDGVTSAYGINNAGTVVGTADFIYPEPADLERHAISYAHGVVTDLGTLYGRSASANAINNLGHIVGGSDIGGPPNWPLTPFLLRDGVMLDLGPFEGPWSQATSINDLDQVVGYANLNTAGDELYPRRAFLWDDGVMTLIDGFGATKVSYAWDINQRGQIVGWADDAMGGRGFLYEGGAMIDINTLIDAASGWVIADAQAINDVQQIAGTACRAGLCYAVRLDLAQPVPEPATWSLLLGGVALLGWRRRCTTRRLCLSWKLSQ